MRRMSKQRKASNWDRKYQRRQKAINGYARQMLCPRVSSGVIQVYHPDEYRRYLHRGPCGDCPVKGFCDTPCQVYLRWYDERMSLFRGLLSAR
jgi:hypothetical protein